VHKFSLALICALSIAVTGCGGGGSSAIPAHLPSAEKVGKAKPVGKKLAGANPYQTLVLNDNPIAYYRLNDTTSTLADSSVNGLAGVYGANVKQGGPALTAGAGSQSAIFPGAAAGAVIPANTATVPTSSLFAATTSNLSVEAWIEPSAANTANAYVPLISYGRELQGQAWVLQESPQSTLVFYLKVTGGAATSYLVNTNAALTAGHVYHVVATYNGSTIYVYVNGALVATTAATGSVNYSGLQPQWGLAIGGAEGSSEPIFNGAISDVAVYPTALAAGDIANHYTAGYINPNATPASVPSPPNTAYATLITASNPLAYYKLNDTGTTMADSGPNAINGVYGSGVVHGAPPMTSSADAASVFPGGASGESIPLNTGTLPANSIFNTAVSTVSVEAWIKLADYNRTNAYVPIVSYGRGGIGSVWAIQLTPQTTLAFYIKVNGSPTSYLVNSLPVLPNQIYHVVATYTGTSANVYINGMLATSGAATGTLNYTGYPPQYGLTVGGAAGSNSPVFNGTITDLSIYATALAPAVISNHYLVGEMIKPVTETPAQSDNLVDSIGVVTHLRETGPYTASFPAFQSLIHASGIRHIGDSLTTDPAFYVQEVNQLASVGIHASLITDPTQNAQTILGTIPAFGTAIEAVEGLNEPDISGDPNWVADTQTFQQMLYTTIKGNASTAMLPVVGPSITSQANDSMLGDLSAYMDYGSMHDYFDGYNPGTPGWGSLGHYGVYGSLAYNCAITGIVSGTKPIFATETGYGNGPTDSGGVDNQTLAKYAPRLYLEHFLNGVKRTTIYEFYDEPGNGNFDDFGLVQSNNAPKPSYYALQSLITTLADPGTSFTTAPLSYILGGNLNNVQHLLLQKRNGTYELVLWVEAEGYNPSTKTDITITPQAVTLQPGYLPATSSITTIGNAGTSTSSALTFPYGVANFSIDDHVTIVTFK
jgi:hypothetical protein